MKELAEASEALPLDTVDVCDEDLLNRIPWFAMKGPHSSYPSWGIVPVNQRGGDDG